MITRFEVLRLGIGGMTTWENPHPAKVVASIDFIKIGDSTAAPFCVAITLEAK